MINSMVGAKGRQKMNLEHLAISEIKRLLKKKMIGACHKYMEAGLNNLSTEIFIIIMQL